MGATHSNRDALGRAGDGVGRIVATPVEALVEGITGRSPMERIKSNTRQSLTDILLLPGRMAKHTAVGLLKGAGKLLWKGMTNLPILPTWTAERTEVAKRTRSDLDILKRCIEPPPDAVDTIGETARIAA